MTAADVKAALRRRHGCDGGSGQWVCIEEAFCGWQSAGGGIDMLAIGGWRSAKAPGLPGAGRGDQRNPVVSYEVKVSRSDMRRELYGYQPGPNTSYRSRPVPPWPFKAYWALQRSHYFMFAVPAGLLTDEELEHREPRGDEKGRPLWLPPEAGLLEVGDGGKCRIRVDAPKLDVPVVLGAAEVAELVRHAVDPNRERVLRERVAYLEQTVASYNRRLAEAGVAA